MNLERLIFYFLQQELNNQWFFQKQITLKLKEKAKAVKDKAKANAKAVKDKANALKKQINSAGYKGGYRNYN